MGGVQMGAHSKPEDNAQADFTGAEFHDYTAQVGQDIGPRGRFGRNLRRQEGTELLIEWKRAQDSGDEIEISDAGTKLAEYVAEGLGVTLEEIDHY